MENSPEQKPRLKRLRDFLAETKTTSRPINEIIDENLPEEKNHLKTKMVAIRVTEEEYLKIKKFASGFNLPTGMYMRLCSLLGYLPYPDTKSDLTVSDAIKEAVKNAVNDAVKITGLRPKSSEGEVTVERQQRQSRSASK